MQSHELAFEDWLEGLKYKDIAGKYNVKGNTVKSWYKRYN
ncbi:helix-turn-helix domain-containing protein [Lysinibacillus sp. CTST325]